jgi:hypothetical protein
MSRKTCSCDECEVSYGRPVGPLNITCRCPSSRYRTTFEISETLGGGGSSSLQDPDLTIDTHEERPKPSECSETEVLDSGHNLESLRGHD